KKGLSVGVEIGYDALRLVKIGQKRQLLDWRTVPFPPGVARGGANFPPFLRSVLSDFCGSGRDIEVWSAVSTADLELRYLRIPKLPKKQVPNAVFWTFKKENPFNEKENIFDFEVLGDTIEEGVRKTEVMAYVAPREEIEELKRAFTKAGYPLTGLTAVPFALQNLYRAQWIKAGEESVCNLYIGRNWSRIDVFSGGNILLSRGIRAGVNSMIEAIQDGLRNRLAPGPGEIPVTVEEDQPLTRPVEGPEAGVSREAAQEVFGCLLGDAAREISPGLAGRASGEEAFDLIIPALDRLIRQIERTLDHYTQKMGGGPVARVFAGGEICRSRRVLDYLSGQLAVPVETLAPFTAADPSAGPGRSSSAYAVGVGLALAGNAYTPNFIFTYKDKEAAATALRLKRTALAIFIVLMTLMGTAYLWQWQVLTGKRAMAAELRRELDQFVPNVDKDIILQVMSVKNQNDKKLEEYGRRYITLALLGELTAMTPENIRLISVTLELGPAAEEPKKPEGETGAGQEAKAPPVRILKMEGFVAGNRAAFEATLAEYLLRLQMSPLFGRPSLKTQKLRELENQEILDFHAELEVL
ncbi:MAG: hypothetical protein AB1896_18280, partial [Thermodesulfobacteriota bacterium]